MDALVYDTERFTSPNACWHWRGGVIQRLPFFELAAFLREHGMEPQYMESPQGRLNLHWTPTGRSYNLTVVRGREYSAMRILPDGNYVDLRH